MIIDYLHFFKWILKMENRPEIHKLKFQIFMTKHEDNPRKLRRLQKLIFYNFGLQVISQSGLTNKENTIHRDKFRARIINNRQFQVIKRNQLKIRDISKDYQFQLILIYNLCLEWDLNFFSRFRHQQIRLVENMKTSQSSQNWFMIININKFENYNNFVLKKMSHFPLQLRIKKWLKWITVYQNIKDFSDFDLFKIFSINLILFDLITFLKNKIRTDRNSSIFYENSKLLIINLTSKKLFLVLRLIKKWEQKHNIRLRYHSKIAPLHFGFCFFNLNFKSYKNQENRIKFKVEFTNSNLVKILSLFDFYWRKARGKCLSYIIQKLNPLIQKIYSFYSNFIDISFFKKLDHWLLLKSWRYLRCYHPNKSNQWIYSQYYSSRRILTYEGYPLQRFYIFYDNKTQLFLYRFITYSYSSSIIQK